MMTNVVKNALLRYYRFDRGFPYVATECWDEDVVVSDGKKLLCIEVKISWADYRAEFQKAKHKAKSQYWSKYVRAKKNNPNRVYFAAPVTLATRIATDLDQSAPIYGVLSIDDYGNVSVFRKAQEIHNKPVNSASLEDMVKRLTSELITMREVHRT